MLDDYISVRYVYVGEQLSKDLFHHGFQNVVKIDDALQTFFSAVGNPAIPLERVNVPKAVDRILGEDIVAISDIPSMDLSVMDGYAVRSDDVQSASENRPVVLEVVGESRIGEVCKSEVKAGQSLAVATGTMIPSGADTVVMVERTAKLSGNQVSIHAPASPGQNIWKKGEDVAAGMQVLNRGRRLRVEDVGILRRLGFSRVRVVRKPRIAIFSTGNELVDYPRKADRGKIVDINRPILFAMVRELGAEPVDLGIARDRKNEIMRILRKSVKSCAVTVVSAGSSVGERDLVPMCINELGRPGMLVHGVAMRPSLPTGLGIVNGKPILSLPGFPVSAIIAFRVFGRPLIAKLMGTSEPTDHVVKAVLTEQITGPLGYRTFVRVMVRKTTEGLVAEPLKFQRSSVLMSMVAANGIVTIPEGLTEYEAGKVVDVSIIGEIPV